MGCGGCWGPRRGVLFVAGGVVFWGSRFACDCAACGASDRGARGLALCTFLGGPPVRGFWGLVSAFLGWVSADLVWGFGGFCFLRALWAGNCRGVSAILDF